MKVFLFTLIPSLALGSSKMSLYGADGSVRFGPDAVIKASCGSEDPRCMMYDLPKGLPRKRSGVDIDV